MKILFALIDLLLFIPVSIIVFIFSVIYMAYYELRYNGNLHEYFDDVKCIFKSSLINLVNGSKLAFVNLGKSIKGLFA